LHFALCLKLGVLHPDYLQEMMTATQLMEWEAYDQIEPIGEWRSDYHAAYISFILADIAHSQYGKPGSQRPELKNFFPFWWQIEKQDKKEKQTTDEIYETMMEIATLSQNNKELTPDEIKKIRGTRKPTLLKNKQ